MKKIGLIDVDSHNYPNLALMKISSFHKKKGNYVGWVSKFYEYDIIYKSKIFSFTPDNEYQYNTNKLIEGGSGYSLKTKLPDEIDSMCPDYSLYDCKHAYGFLTRGCVRNCSWCLVPEKEGRIKPNADIEEFIGDKRTAILMDNNVLASPFGMKQIEKIIKLGIKVDFNQGLDARLIDDACAKLLSKVKWLYPLRLACDTQSMIEPVRKAVEKLRWFNCVPRRYFVYVLVSDIIEAKDRIKFLKGINVDIFAQIYRDFKKDDIVLTQQQKDLVRWVNRKAIFNKVTFMEYRRNVKHEKNI